MYYERNCIKDDKIGFAACLQGRAAFIRWFNRILKKLYEVGKQTQKMKQTNSPFHLLTTFEAKGGKDDDVWKDYTRLRSLFYDVSVSIW